MIDVIPPIAAIESIIFQPGSSQIAHRRRPIKPRQNRDEVKHRIIDMIFLFFIGL